MLFLMVCLFLPLMTFCDNFDPDIDICVNTSLDAAVFTDDDMTYVFKGKYFWKINDLDTKTKNTSYGELITDKWPEMKGPVKAAFAVKNPKTKTLVTVFVVGNRFYAYEKGVKVLDGSTDNWQTFNGLQVSATFAKNRKDRSPLVFVVHTNGSQYTFFNFASSLTKPTVSSPAPTTIRQNFVFFLENNIKPSKTNERGPQSLLNSIFDVRAAIAYNSKLVLIGSTEYCIIDLKQEPNEKKCNLEKTTSELIGCPINIENRPPTPKPTGDLNEQRNGTIGGDFITESNVTQKTNTSTIDTNKSTIFAIGFNSSLIFVTIILMVIIVIISRVNHRSKGNVYHIK